MIPGPHHHHRVELGCHTGSTSRWLSLARTESRLEPARVTAPGPSLFLVADAHLIAYGATVPGARLRIAEREVPHSEDGTFRVEAPFPSGCHDVPIEALDHGGCSAATPPFAAAAT